MPEPKPPSSPRPCRNKRLGRIIRRMRGKAGLTQLALAHRMGRRGDDAGAYVCRLEKGHQNPTLDTLTLISKALDVPLGDLL